MSNMLTALLGASFASRPARPIPGSQGSHRSRDRGGYEAGCSAPECTACIRASVSPWCVRSSLRTYAIFPRSTSASMGLERLLRKCQFVCDAWITIEVYLRSPPLYLVPLHMVQRHYSGCVTLRLVPVISADACFIEIRPPTSSPSLRDCIRAGQRCHGCTV